MSKPAIAFFSYVRSVDEYEEGRLSQFRERLSGEVSLQTGESFDIFQDRKDIKWGQQWKERIEDSVDGATFLIPILTPGYFKRDWCRNEFLRFIDREKELGRGDLILPVYYVNCPVLQNDAQREQDEIARTIAARNYIDWRELRFEPWTSPQVGRLIAQLAEHIVEALERDASPKPPAPPKKTSKTTAKTTPEAKEAADNAQPAVTEKAEAAQGPAPKNEPPTLVVDQMHRGDCTTINEAIQKAKPGTRILVRPGRYQEGLIIDKPLEIIGDGPLEDIVIEANGKRTIDFQTTMGRIANLTLRQTGGSKYYGVNIAQGRLELEGCDISSQSLSCVAIHDGADPRLRRNRIHDGKQTGVFVYENGQGTLEDNDIFGNALAGVQISEESNPILRRNRIHDGKEGGVYVSENGQGTLEDNDIFSNTLAGVSIAKGGNPTLHQNRIKNNRLYGVRVYEDGAGVIEDNDLRDNKRGAFFIAPDCEAKVKRARNIEE